jgi:hypothetical protein
MRAVRCATGFALAAIAVCLFALAPARAAEGDGHSSSPLHAWFDNLASGRGLCCSFADGLSVQDVDWDTQDGRYGASCMGSGLSFPTTRS